MRRHPTLTLLSVLLLMPVGLALAHEAAADADAKAFITRASNELVKLWSYRERMGFVQNTYITDDTTLLVGQAEEQVMEATARLIKESMKYDAAKADADTARQLKLLRLSSGLPAPSDPAERTELATIAADMGAMYGKGRYCKTVDGKENCRELPELSKVLRESENYDELLDAWNGWHTISVPMKPKYERYVELANKGAREIGFKDTADLWRSRYDMAPDAFEKETDRLWTQVKPLYDQLHCYVRAKLSAKYGKDKVPLNGPIPAHLLGNMWAQEWANVYKTVEPFPGQGNPDVTTALKDAGYDAVKMVKLGEKFFTSLGMDPLPATFWTRSQFVKPRDRDVVCHASAWDVTYENDLRIKMCIEVNEEDLITIHHELGHNYYYQAYYKQPPLYRDGANDGFHEGIGDTLALSVTPGYLKSIGIFKDVVSNEKADINLMMKSALEKVAFLPFGKLIDQWRWNVFSGKTKPADYNKAWWELRRKYQGVAPATARPDDAFDPGAKYHVPANVPYTRYFLARILQFQFHRALCKAAGHKGPLHTCSIYGNKEAGKKLQAMLAMGSSKPWPDALFAVTGEKQMDATAMLDYFAPLSKWLAQANKGQKCGW